MQGNERHSSEMDPQFVDQAWGEMSAMLDREMPVTQVPSTGHSAFRRYGLLLLVLVIGFAAGVGTMLYWQPTTPDALQPPFEQPKNETPTMAPPAVAQAEFIPQARSDIASNASSVAATPTRGGTSSTNDPLDSSTKTTNYSSKIYTSNPDHTAKENNLGQVATIPVEQESNRSIKDLPTMLTEAATNDRRTQILPLADLDKTSVSLQVDEHIHEMSSLVFPERSERLRFGLMVSVHSAPLAKVSGASAGFNVEYQLDDRFAVRSGISYTMYRDFFNQNNDYTPYIIDPTFDLNGELFDQYSTTESSKNVNVRPVSQMEYVEMPVALVYQASDRWRINLGVKMSYLLSVRDYGRVNRHDSNGGFNNPSPTTPIASNETSINDLLYQGLRKFDFATVIGIGFYPRPNYGLEVRFNRGMVDYTKDKFWNIRQINANRSFELGMHYNF